MPHKICCQFNWIKGSNIISVFATILIIKLPDPPAFIKSFQIPLGDPFAQTPYDSKPLTHVPDVRRSFNPIHPLTLDKCKVSDWGGCRLGSCCLDELVLTNNHVSVNILNICCGDVSSSKSKIKVDPKIIYTSSVHIFISIRSH